MSKKDISLRWGITVDNEDWEGLKEHLLYVMDEEDRKEFPEEYVNSQEFQDKRRYGFEKELGTLSDKLKICGGFCCGDEGVECVSFQTVDEWESPEEFAKAIGSLGSILDTRYFPEDGSFTIYFYEINSIGTKFEKHEEYGQIDKINIQFYNVTKEALPYLKDIVDSVTDLEDFIKETEKEKENQNESTY